MGQVYKPSWHTSRDRIVCKMEQQKTNKIVDNLNRDLRAAKRAAAREEAMRTPVRHPIAMETDAPRQDRRRRMIYEEDPEEDDAPDVPAVEPMVIDLTDDDGWVPPEQDEHGVWLIE